MKKFSNKAVELKILNLRELILNKDIIHRIFTKPRFRFKMYLSFIAPCFIAHNFTAFKKKGMQQI